MREKENRRREGIENRTKEEEISEEKIKGKEEDEKGRMERR